MYDPAVVNATIPKVLAEYPASNYADGWARASDLLTHYFFTCGVRRSARAVVANKADLWLYVTCLLCLNVFGYSVAFFSAQSHDLSALACSLRLMLFVRLHFYFRCPDRGNEDCVVSMSACVCSCTCDCAA